MSLLGYLSGAPRVSTRDDAALGAPRAHILGVIQGFEENGWGVKKYIVGDKMPSSWTDAKSEGSFTSSQFKVLMADLVRIYLGARSGRRAAKEFGGDVSMVYERLASFQALGLPFKRRGIPWILETQAPLFHEAKESRNSMVLSGLAKKIEISAYRQCDAVICVSSSLKDIMIEHAEVDARKIIVVPNGVDLEKFNPEKYESVQRSPVFTVGFVGGLFKWQAIDNLINALDVLVKSGKEIRLVVVGDGTMRPQAGQLAASLGLSNRIEFVGYVAGKEVPRYISSFDVCFSGQVPHGLGTMYGSPMKLYEYMAMGKPVLASAYDDAKALISDCKDGFLFEPQSHESLVAGLERAYDYRAELPRMGMIARQKIIRDHSWRTRVQGMLERFGEIMSG